MVEQARVPRVPPLGQAPGLLDRRFLLRVVIDVEVIRGENEDAIGVVLDLVAPEVLGAGSIRQAQDQHG